MQPASRLRPCTLPQTRAKGTLEDTAVTCIHASLCSVDQTFPHRVIVSTISGVQTVANDDGVSVFESVRPRLFGIDPDAKYFGTELGERSLVPDDGAQLGDTRFEVWLMRSAAGPKTASQVA